jgi:hypothetical protein
MLGILRGCQPAPDSFSAGISAGCWVGPEANRWCRFAQPLANGCDAFGIRKRSCDVRHHGFLSPRISGVPSHAPPLPMVRRSQSMGVHPRLGRGDAASGLLYSGGRLQARREMTRLHIGNAHVPHGPQFLRKFQFQVRIHAVPDTGHCLKAIRPITPRPLPISSHLWHITASDDGDGEPI